MPAKNRIKQYIENSYYHIYNRGVEKKIIFVDEKDYSVFLSYIKEYLMPKNEQELLSKLSDPNLSYRERDKANRLLKLNNFFGEIKLIAYCLMPNHFHLFVKQKSANSIDRFMNSLCTRYTMYFNKRYKRVGSLYQDVYKAVLVTNDNQFIYLSKYIHQQALASKGLAFRGQPSSFEDYLGMRKTEWVHPDEILSHFSKSNIKLSYEAFVTQKDGSEYDYIQSLSIEE